MLEMSMIAQDTRFVASVFALAQTSTISCRQLDKRFEIKNRRQLTGRKLMKLA
jgi:hypothetical protein